MSEAAPAFGRGGSAVAEAERAEKAAREAAKSARKSGRSVSYLSLKEGESTIIRHLMEEDEWIYAKMFNFVPTKAKPADYPEGRKWPANQGAVDRYDEAFKGIYSDCFIADHLTKDYNGTERPYQSATRVNTLAVEREEIIGTQDMVDKGEISAARVGKRVGIRDVMVEVEEKDDQGNVTGTKLTPKILFLQYAMSNFFNQFLAYAEEYETLRDRDYKIKRVGSGTDTSYIASPLDPVKVDGKILDLNEPEFADRYEFDVSTIADRLAYMASDHYYRVYFDTRYDEPWSTKGEASSEKKTDLPEKNNSDSDTDESSDKKTMDDIRAKVAGLGRREKG